MVGEKSGGPVSYYLVQVNNPNQGSIPYQAECGDIIEALGMNFNEGCAFKAIWRSAAARTLGKVKQGGDAVYDAEKVAFYGQRMKAVLVGKKDEPDHTELTETFEKLDALRGSVTLRVRNIQRLLDHFIGIGRLQACDIAPLLQELNQLSNSR